MIGSHQRAAARVAIDGRGLDGHLIDEIVGLYRVDAHRVPALDARGTVWLEPVQVAEIAYGEWTPEGRVRHPRWRGWRPDKDVADIRLD